MSKLPELAFRGLSDEEEEDTELEDGDLDEGFGNEEDEGGENADV